VSHSPQPSSTPVPPMRGTEGDTYEVPARLILSDARYFWYIASPVMIVTVLVLMRPMIWRWVSRQASKVWLRRQKIKRVKKAERRHRAATMRPESAEGEKARQRYP
jgi:hypothetical protein